MESHPQNPAKKNACTTTYTWLFTLVGACCGGGSVGGEGGDGTGIGSSGVPY